MNYNSNYTIIINNKQLLNYDLIRGIRLLSFIGNNYGVQMQTLDYITYPNSSIDKYSTRLSETEVDLKDNHKPQFKDCATYKPSVKEEQTRGTYVIKVELLDLLILEFC